MRPSPFLVLIVLVQTATARAAETVLSGPVDRLAVGAGLVAAVRGQEVRILHEDGRPLLRLVTPLTPPAGSADRRQRDEELLDEHGLDELDRASPEGEELLDDERRLQRPPAPADGSRDRELQPVVAASESSIWVSLSDALWQLDRAGLSRRFAPIRPRPDALAAVGGTLFAAHGAQIVRSDDGGRSFVAWVRADGPVDRLVAASDGRLAWISAGSVGRSAADGVIEAPPPGRARDIAFCGDLLLVLKDGEIILETSDGARVVPLPTPAARLVCDSGRWVAAGPGLCAASRGAARLRVDAPSSPVSDVAFGTQGLWVATTTGLVLLPADEPTRKSPRAGASTTTTQTPSWWGGLLPRIVLAGSAQSGVARRDLRALAFADWDLGSPPPPRMRVAQVDRPAPAPDVTLPRDTDARCLVESRTAAVSLAGVNPERARSLLGRARHAAWLPELRLRIDRRLGRSESLDLAARTTLNGTPLDIDTDDDVRFEARATWDLSRLVWSGDEVAAESHALRAGDTRRELESTFNRLYFERRRLVADALLAVPEPPSSLRRGVRVEEIEADLDALSGGHFSRCTGSTHQQTSP